MTMMTVIRIPMLSDGLENHFPFEADSNTFKEKSN